MVRDFLLASAHHLLFFGLIAMLVVRVEIALVAVILVCAAAMARHGGLLP